jgi:hypothetical protein
LANPFSNFVIVQNKSDPIRNPLTGFFVNSAVVHYWPQPGLVPRHPERGCRFENVCYVGNSHQFVSEISFLQAEIKHLGLNWSMPPREKWNDYTQIDAVVAVRPSIGAMRSKPEYHILRKPASKLVNAWLAGVPAILSPDVAYRNLRKSSLDYLEATDCRQIVVRLRQLIDNPAMINLMRENGRQRAVEFELDRIIQMWLAIFRDDIIPAYRRWTESSARRFYSILSRHLARKFVPSFME